MASATATLNAPSPIAAPAFAWLRNPQFDFTLIVVVASWALAAGAAIVVQPSLFWPILFLDVWLLGYTHVVSTFTRLAFDRESFRQHRMLLIPLPVVVAAFTIGIALVVGEWLVATVYLYAQWFHYTRQSYGISRMYLRKAGAVPASRDWYSTVSSMPCRSGASSPGPISSRRRFSACRFTPSRFLPRCSMLSGPLPR